MNSLIRALATRFFWIGILLSNRLFPHPQR